MLRLLVWTATGRLSVLPAFELQLLQPIEHQLLVQCLRGRDKGQVRWRPGQGAEGSRGASYLEGEGALEGVDVETVAAVGLQQGAEGGATESDPTQRGLVLWPAIV